MENFALRSIFAPHEDRRRNDLLLNNRRLIHYTSAAAALSIIQKRKVWMRNVRCMNDVMEVEHGIELMLQSSRPPEDTQVEHGLRMLAQVLDSIHPGISQEAFDWFDGWSFALRNKTYVTCLSEHDPAEDELGRLSMWRSYTANQVGVGLVIKPIPLYSLSTGFGAFSSPVYYFGEKEIENLFLEVAQAVAEKKAFVASFSKDDIRGYFCMLLRSIAMCTKHPGFVEEKEWRIMHTEGLDDKGALERDVECINGIPQPVYKISLEDHQASGMVGITIPALIEKVLIGPTQFPIQVWDAMVIELEKAGVPEPDKLVSYAGIPLRTAG